MDGVVTATREADGQTLKASLSILSDLSHALSRSEVRYCYWKSNARFKAVLAGDSDLDLLVARDDQHRIMAILLATGFKLFPAARGREHPAVQSFLGYDEPSGRLVHVHLHAHLVLGESLLKNYWLPWDTAILMATIVDPASGFRILDPASEAVLLIVRRCLEPRIMDPVALANTRGVERKFLRDREVLAARVSRDAFRTRCAAFLEADTADILAGLLHGEAGAGEWRRAAKRVRRELAPFRMYGSAEGRLRGAARGVRWLAGGLNKRYLHAPRPWNRVASGGGQVVALLGVDGSGKSTIAAALRAWLAPEVDVMPIYFGTGDGRPSLLLLPFKLMVPLATAVLRTKPRGSSHGAVSGRPPGVLYSVFLAAWATVLALEKRSKLRAAYRGARRGMVVLTDRYPQDEIADYNDGPLLPRLARVPLPLRRFEARSYALARRLSPDLVVKLEAPPEVLQAREPNMDRTVLRHRVAAVQQLSFPGARVVRVDATRPLDDVIRAVKGAVWSVL